MKIAIPVNDKSLETLVSESFGRANYFFIFDTENNESIIIDNTATNAQGAAGIKAAQTIVDENINILITPQCGQNAANVLKSADIKLYKAINNSIQDNLNAFNEGKLSLLDNIHSGFHNHGERK